MKAYYYYTPMTYHCYQVGPTDMLAGCHIRQAHLCHVCVCVFVFFQWQQLYTRQRPIGPDTPFAFAKGFRGQTEKQRGTKNSLRRITALESATVVAAKSMCVRATAGYPGLEAPVSSPGAVAAYFSESRSCSRSGPKQW